LKPRQVEPDLSNFRGDVSPLKKILRKIRGWNFLKLAKEKTFCRFDFCSCGRWTYSLQDIGMGTSIVVDVSRSRALSRTARKFRSQALEADALHFSTDIWSSAVVIFGLVCVMVGRWVPSLDFLHHADAVAAIGVALIVVYVSGQLTIRTTQALLDVAPFGLEKKIIATVESLPGVSNCHDVRMRYSGSQLFVDIHVLTDGNQTLKDAHNLTEEIERTIQNLVPKADVVVHPEPTPEPTDS